MKPIFRPARRSVRKWTFVCFLLVIVAGWGFEIVFLRSTALGPIDTAPFRVFESGAFVGATSSVFYSAFIWLFYTLGASLGGFQAGVLTFSFAQLGLCAIAFSYGAFWIHKKGAPFWFAIFVALCFAAFLPFVRGALQPWIAVPTAVCLFLLTLRLIDAAQDGCKGLRLAGSICSLLTLQALLLLLDLSMLFVVVPTLIIMTLMPIREKAFLALQSACMLLLTLAALAILFPRIGWTEDEAIRPLGVSGAESFMPNISSVEAIPFLFAPLVATLVILVWVAVNRRPRHLLPFVPLIGLGVLLIASPFVRLAGFWFLDYAYVLCLPFLFFVPLFTEYTETKVQVRKRILGRRSAIPTDDRAHRGEEACKVLLEKLKDIKPADGYIALYSAQGSELPLNSLAVQLGNLGYRVAYPARISDTEMEFFTTLGVSNEALFESLLIDKPFESIANTDIEHLTKLEPGELSALVVPAVAYDKNCNRLGFGGGYYDRYLKKISSSVPKYGVCFQEQMVGVLPVEEHDQPLDDIVIAQSAILSTSFHWRHKRD
jgi:5-formyltetrahydrofolate cyclo-ligase